MIDPCVHEFICLISIYEGTTYVPGVVLISGDEAMTRALSPPWCTHEDMYGRGVGHTVGGHSAAGALACLLAPVQGGLGILMGEIMKNELQEVSSPQPSKDGEGT